MKKPVVGVFLLLLVLVVSLLIWNYTVGDGGLMEMATNAVADQVNTVWQKVTGDASAELIPTFDVATDGKDTGSLGGMQ
jgi:hypothetical protein